MYTSINPMCWISASCVISASFNEFAYKRRASNVKKRIDTRLHCVYDLVGNILGGNSNGYMHEYQGLLIWFGNKKFIKNACIMCA